MDLVRDILLRIEEWSPTKDELSLIFDQGPIADPVFHHVGLILDAGFVRAVFMAAPSAYHVSGLTWAGHDFLDSIRDESVWSAVKKKLTAVGGSASIDVLKALVTQVVKGKLGLTELVG